MFSLRSSVCLLYLLTCSCESHSTLELSYDAAISKEELQSVGDFADTTVERVVATPSQGKIIFARELTQSELKRLKTLLDRLKKLKPEAPPLELRLAVTEKDPKVLAALQLTSENLPEVDLGPVSVGKLRVLQKKIGQQLERDCVWSLDMEHEQPTLTYTIEFESQGPNDEVPPSLNVFSKTLAEHGGMRAKHELKPNSTFYQALAAEINLAPPRSAYIRFDTYSETVLFPGMENFPAPEVFKKCRAKILEDASDAFLTGIAFPQSSRSLTNYKFDTTRF